MGDYDKFNFGIQFDGEVYSLLGSASNSDKAAADKAANEKGTTAQTEEPKPMFNYFNDRAYTYMKMGNDVYFQKQGAGKDKADPKQYTKVNPTTQKTAFDAINALTFTATGAK